MNKKQLIKSLCEVKAPEKFAADEYLQKIDTLVARINESFLERDDIYKLIGCKENVDMMKDNHSNHARFIESIIRTFNPEVLTDTVLWVFRAYRTHGFHDIYWSAQLNFWIDCIKDSLSPEACEQILPIYNWMQVNIPEFVDIANQEIELAKTVTQH